MAEHLTFVVRAATAGEGGQIWVSALPCGRRPGRRPCSGHIAVLRTEVPPSIRWHCNVCGDEGVISGWERSDFDLRARRREPGSNPLRVVIAAEVAVTLRSLVLVDSDGERLIFRAGVAEEGVVLDTDEDNLDELLGFVAAEANHEEDRRRRKRLDQAFIALSEAMAQAR